MTSEIPSTDQIRKSGRQIGAGPYCEVWDFDGRLWIIDQRYNDVLPTFNGDIRTMDEIRRDENR